MDEKKKENKFPKPTRGKYYYLPTDSALFWGEKDMQTLASGRVGRYKIPLTFEQRLSLKIREYLPQLSYNFSSTSLPSRDPLYPIPPAWQAIIEYLYAEKTLAMPYLTFDSLAPDDPKIYSARLWATPSASDGGSLATRNGYSRGVSYDFEEALSKVIGEFLERYPLSLYRDKDLYRASISDLRRKKLPFLDPHLADQYSDWQKDRFPSRKFTDTSIFRFVKGRSLTRNSAAYIPAQMVYWNYRFAEDEPVLRSPNSNGAGGMFSYEEAVLSGLYELIQRDGFLSHWLQNKVPQRIDLSSVSNPDIQKCLSNFERYLLEVHILETTSELDVPSFVAVVIDRSGRGPAVTLGGGCGFDQEKAILRCLTESIGVYNWLHSTRENEKDDPLPEMESSEPFTEDWGHSRRLLLWYALENIARIEPFLSGKMIPLDHSKNRVFKSAQAELGHMVKDFAKRGDSYEIFVYRAEHTILDTLEYVSVRVCVPAMLPLYLRETYAPLGAPQLKNVNINTMPHPFP